MRSGSTDRRKALPSYPRPTSSGVTAQMKGNRRADTRPEVALRAALHARGLRFRKDYLVPVAGRRPTRIDIAFTRTRVAVFVDGCFWHSCPEHGHTPRANTAYWKPKLERNKLRDSAVTDALREAGWSVVRVWEHVPLSDAATMIANAVAVLAARNEESGTDRA